MTDLQYLGKHEAADRFGPKQPLTFRGSIDNHATHGCVLTLSFGVTRTQLHLTPDDVRAIAALWLQTADEADLAAGRYTLKPEPSLEKITIPQDVVERLKEGSEPGQLIVSDPSGSDRHIEQVRYVGSWPPGDGGDWWLSKGLGVFVNRWLVERQCEHDASITPGPNALWVRPYTPSERARLPNCAVCRDTQIIWDERAGEGGRYAPCPSCSPAGSTVTADPFGCLYCTHSNCGRFYDENARRYACRAMDQQACARPHASASEANS